MANAFGTPVYDAMVRHDLVMGLHWGGTSDVPPSAGTGWPSYHVEEYAAEPQVFMSQLSSLIGEGVFQVFPLRVSVLEAGFTWLPAHAWRLNKDWKAMRREVPWVKEPPFDIIREHVRFSTAPFDADSADELRVIIDWLGPEDILMFATDYPRMHDDRFETLLDATPSSMRPKLMAESAREWYQL